MQGDPLDRAINLTFGVVEMAASIFGIFLNAITLPYFIKGRKPISGTLYILIVITDILTCFCCLPTAVSMLNQRKAMWMDNKVMCSITGFIFNIVSRLSVFLIAVLSVARTITMCMPFRTYKPIYHLILIGVYLLLNVVLAALPLIFSPDGYIYGEYMGQCSWGIESLSFIKGTNSSLYMGLLYTFIILPWLVPGLIVTISCFISVVFIIKSTKNSQSTESVSKKDRVMIDATITIVIMTAVYIVFNMPCWIFFITVLVNINNPTQWLRTSFALYFNIFVGRLSVVLNSAINPLVYFCRMRGLRFNFWNMIWKGKVENAFISLRVHSITSQKHKVLLTRRSQSETTALRQVEH